MMSRILVSGLANIETTIRVDHFPIPYTPVHYAFNSIRSTVSGVGFNVACALTTLGNRVDFLSLIGEDTAGYIIRRKLLDSGIGASQVLPVLPETPQSTIFYDASGKRMIHVDLKAIQETQYPEKDLHLDEIDLAVLTNTNFSRALLKKANEAGVPIATDIHTISDIEDAYNQAFMANATILFMSHEHLPVPAEQWIQMLWERYETPIIGIGLGSDGALLGIREDRHIRRFPAQVVRPIVNTIGSGDALFSAFIHSYLVGKDPYAAMKKAILFAGYKIGAIGGSEGFLTHDQLEELYHQYNKIGE